MPACAPTIRCVVVAAAVVLPAALLAGCGSGDPSSRATSSATGTPSGATDDPTGGQSSSSTSSGTSVASLGRTRLTVVTRPSATGGVTTRTLTCNPAGGTVADPAAACAQLARAGGTRALAPAARSGAACTQQIAGTDVATLTGTVQGRRVSATLRQNDGCHISQWNSLSSVLGSTAGGN